MATPEEVKVGKKKWACPYLGVWGKLRAALVLFKAAMNEMEVSRNRQSLNALESIVASYWPEVAHFIRRFFDRLEEISRHSAELYRLGTPLFEGFLGPLAEGILRLLGKEALIDKQYR